MEMVMDQLALFENLPAPNAYVPKQEHVRNRLKRIYDALCSAETWPWEPVIVRLYRERTLPYLYELLADAAEAREWRERIEAELLRLNTATPIEPAEFRLALDHGS
jgi:hypothetical protein